jgi:hypothetical protein
MKCALAASDERVLLALFIIIASMTDKSIPLCIRFFRIFKLQGEREKKRHQAEEPLSMALH